MADAPSFVNHKQIFQHLDIMLTAGLQQNELRDLADDFHREGRIEDFGAAVNLMQQVHEVAKELVESLPAEEG